MSTSFTMFTKKKPQEAILTRRGLKVNENRGISLYTLGYVGKHYAHMVDHLCFSEPCKI